tara:strand:- start:2322 stop:2627 length:306 start_codon:yes stop_codon:yes gene_type:complete
MAVVMKAVYDSFGRIVGVETMEVGDQLEVQDESGESVVIDASDALPTFDLTTTAEIELSTTDTNVASEDVGKNVVVGHPVHLDIKSVGSDVTAQDWDGGEW